MTNHKVSSEEVNHPSHYTQFNQEVRDTIQDWIRFYDDPVVAWGIGTVLKYLARAPHKHVGYNIDILKAKNYLDYVVEYLQIGPARQEKSPEEPHNTTGFEQPTTNDEALKDSFNKFKDLLNASYMKEQPDISFSFSFDDEEEVEEDEVDTKPKVSQTDPDMALIYAMEDLLNGLFNRRLKGDLNEY